MMFYLNRNVSVWGVWLYMELLSTPRHSESHKSMCSIICCLTLFTASGELQFLESPEHKKTKKLFQYLSLQFRHPTKWEDGYYIYLQWSLETEGIHEGHFHDHSCDNWQCKKALCHQTLTLLNFFYREYLSESKWRLTVRRWGLFGRMTPWILRPISEYDFSSCNSITPIVQVRCIHFRVNTFPKQAIT